ncbi:MAG: hypothetical protein V3575_06120 [Candidatus Absconditabacteria bacterium]
MKRIIKKSLFIAAIIMGFSFCVGQINQFQMTSNGVSESQIDADSYNGIAGVVYTRDNSVYYRFGLGSEEFVGTGAIPKLAIDSSGNAHVAYITGGVVYYNFYDGDWDNTIIVNSGNSASYVDIDTDSSNTPHIIFRSKYFSDNYADVVYMKMMSGIFTEIRSRDGLFTDYGGASGHADYYSDYPINIHIDNNDNYHLNLRHYQYEKSMSIIDRYYYIRYYTNIGGGDSVFGGYNNNKILYGNGIATIGNNAYGIYDSPIKIVSMTSAWSDNSAWEAGTPNIASDGTNLGLAYIVGTDLKYAIANGTSFGTAATIATGATELAFTMSDGKFFLYYIKSDGVDNEIYLQTNAVLDTAPPTMNITYPSNGTIVNGDAIIQFTGTELDSPECSIDNSNWSSCVSGTTKLSQITGFNNLGEGLFTLYMTETDLAGNMGTGSSSGITKDSTAPNQVYSGTVIPSSFYAIYSGLILYDLHFNYTGGLLYYGTGNNTGDLMNQSMTGMNFSITPSPIDPQISNYWALENLTMDGLVSNSPYNYFYKVFDYAGNEFVSQVYNFTTLPDPVQQEFVNIDNSLNLSGIVSNLEQVNSFNVNGFSGLYFEKPNYGKVTFSGSIDLTDPDTQNFLYSLDEYLSMNLGYLNFELVGTELADYGATIQLYLENETFPNGPLSNDVIVIRDDLGNNIDPSSIISGLHCYGVSLGNIVQVCEFNTEHFTSFDLKPILVSVNVYSNNQNNTELAKVGNTFYLQFTGSEPLDEIDVNIGGKLYSLGEVNLTGSGNSWTASLTLSGDISEGNILFEITYSDLYGNDGTAVTVTSNGSNVEFDNTIPSANINYTETNPTNQSLYAILTGYSENLNITNNGGSNTYFFTGNGSFTFEFEDEAGNIGTSIATVDWIDKTKPTASIDYNPSTPTNQNVIATLTGISESITITNNGGSGQYLFTDNGIFTFNFEDAVGNTGATSATVDFIDRINPTADIHYSYTGITNQDVVASLTGLSENITVTNNGGNLAYTFTGNGSFTFVFEDDAGNIGTGSALVTNIDKDKPNVPILIATDKTIGSGELTIEGIINEGYKINIYLNNVLLGGYYMESRGVTYNSGTMEFSVIVDDLHFNEGENTLSISESDEAGNESDKSSNIIITKDTQGPTISNDYITDITNNAANLYFDFADDNMSTNNWTGFVEVYNPLLIDDGSIEDGRIGEIFPITLYLNTGKGYASAFGLNSKTKYIYKIYITDDLGNTNNKNGFFETATNPVNLGNNTYQGITTFTGTVQEGDQFNLSGFNFIVQSNTGDFQHGLSGALSLSGISSFTISGSNWNGILMPPTAVLSGYNEYGDLGKLNLDSEFGSGTQENSQVLGTFKVGAGSGTSLIPNDGLFRIEIYVGEGLSGNTYYIYRSNDGNSWGLNTPDSTCTLGSDLICAYYTDHLSYFAPVQVNDTTPSSFSFATISNAELNTNYESATVTIQGMTSTSNFTVNNGLASVNGGAYTNSGTINNGDNLKLKNTSSTSYNNTVTTTITIGAAQGTFQIITKSQANVTSGGGGGGIGGTITTWNLSDTQSKTNGQSKTISIREYNSYDLGKTADKYNFDNELFHEAVRIIREYVEKEADMAIMLGFLDGKKYQYYNELNTKFETLMYEMYKYDQGEISKARFKNQVKLFAKYLQSYNEIKGRLLVKVKINIGGNIVSIMKAKSVQVLSNEAVSKILEQYIDSLGKKTFTKKQSKNIGNLISKILIGYSVALDADKGVGKNLLEKFVNEYNLLDK